MLCVAIFCCIKQALAASQAGESAASAALLKAQAFTAIAVRDDPYAQSQSAGSNNNGTSNIGLTTAEHLSAMVDEVAKFQKAAAAAEVDRATAAKKYMLYSLEQKSFVMLATQKSHFLSPTSSTFD